MYAQPLLESTLPMDAVDATVSLPFLECALHWLQQDGGLQTDLQELLAQVLAQADTLQAHHRHVWRCVLRGLLVRDGDGWSDATLELIVELALAWCDWPLVLQVDRRLQARGQAAEPRQLACAVAHWQLGAHAQATDLCRALVLAQAEKHSYWQQYRVMSDWLTHWETLGLAENTLLEEGELRLEPLGDHHLQEFAWQYYDPDIAARCCLPCYQNSQQWFDWLDEVHDFGDQLLFAVVHREWGFLGVVSLVLHEGVGFFYYWIGRDHQGQGYGPQAAGMLMRLAHWQWGMRCCYAKVFKDNQRSRRGLEKVGFQQLQVSALPPNDSECFYRFGDTESAQLSVHELQTLLNYMGSSTRLMAIVGAQMNWAPSAPTGLGRGAPGW